MKFGIRTMLLLVAVFAISFPFAFRHVQLATQPELSVCSTAKYTNYEFPHINCICVHDAPWGRVRIVVLHRVTSELHSRQNMYPHWVDPNYVNLPLRINGTEIFAGDDVLVYYAEDDSAPKSRRMELSKIPLDEPSWPNPAKLWNLITDSDVESKW